MPRPSTADQRRRDLLPTIAEVFARTGYARATTAELAQRCAVPENTLFRLWGGKKGMYLAALDHLYERTIGTWSRHLARAGGAPSAAELLLDHEGRHYGEHGLYRIVFTGLSEIDDPDIRGALRTMYRRFHAFVAERITAHRGRTARGAEGRRVAQLAWTVIGMATVAGIGRELGLVSRAQQRELFSGTGRALLDLHPDLETTTKRGNRS
jgi:AcrR family transcriptional regulator